MKASLQLQPMYCSRDYKYSSRFNQQYEKPTQYMWFGFTGPFVSLDASNYAATLTSWSQQWQNVVPIIYTGHASKLDTVLIKNLFNQYWQWHHKTDQQLHHYADKRKWWWSKMAPMLKWHTIRKNLLNIFDLYNLCIVIVYMGVLGTTLSDTKF